MKYICNTSHYKQSRWLRIRAILLCVLAAIFLFSTATVAIAEGISQHGETRAQVKNRLMRQIRNDGWDPYSANMTLDEFYALMELFDEGKLPLKDSSKAGLFSGLFSMFSDDGGDDTSTGEDSKAATHYIPRTMFIYAGLPDSYLNNEDPYAPLEYENKTNYEPYDPTTGKDWTVVSDDVFATPNGDKYKYVRAEGSTEGEVDKLVKLDDIGNQTDEFLVASQHFAYYYPEGLDKYNGNYKRPANSWKGIEVSNSNLRVTIVEEGLNDEDKTTTGNTNQELFRSYTDYYVRRVSISGTDISVLGMLKMPGSDDKFVYYYLSTEGQSTQVSTTTLPDTAKFIVEYVPIEHTVDYAIIMAEDFFESESGDTINASAAKALLENAKESNSQGYVHEKVTDPKVTIDSVFTNRPDRTTDGAYAFDVLAPYGYTTKVYICIYMDKKTWFASTPKGDGTGDNYTGERQTADIFPVGINHTGKKEKEEQHWLESYYKYLCDIEFINSSNQLWVGNSSGGGKYSSTTVGSYSDFITKCIKRETITDEFEDTTIKFTWNIDGDTNKVAHDSMLERMAERINDFVLHNDGYPLGTSPVWKLQNPKLVPDTDKGPSAYTWMETFYNHLVKADRTIVAVLEPIEAPMFDVSDVLKFDNAKGRGSAATAQWAYASDDQFREYYVNQNESYAKGGLDSYQSGGWPNIQTYDSWGWNGNGDDGYQYWKGPVAMNNAPEGSMFKHQNDDGSYNYNFLFQTNDPGQNYFMDVLEINGVAMTIPYRPRYRALGYEPDTPEPDENFSWQTVNYLPDGAKVTVEFWFGWAKGQRHYRIRIEGVHVDVTITSLNLMQQGSGANEFSVYNLVGVYADATDTDQSTAAIEYYSKNSKWVRTEKSQVIVDDKDNNGISYDDADTGNYGANIRFKVADGYGSPYYLWESPRYGVATDQSRKIYQASVDVTMVNNFATPNLEKKHAIIYFSDIVKKDSNGNNYNGVGKLVGDKLDSRYIYYNDLLDENGQPTDGYGYYYIRVSGQYNPTSQNSNDTLKIALLTIVAVPVGYVVRYIPSYYSLGLGQDGNPIYSSYYGDELTGVVNDPGNMPQFDHTGCVFADHGDTGRQYDDNLAAYYKRGTTSNIVSIPADPNGGVIRPTDSSGKYLFVNWVLVDADYQPILLDEQDRLVKRKDDGTYYYVSNKRPVPEHLESSIHTINYLGGSFDINDLADYAVHRLTFSDVSLDIYVLRFMPVWEKIENPFEYNVVLNWVDSNGTVHQENFSDNWDKVITETPEDDSSLFVYLNKEAAPLLDWIAMHPTYTFWDAVNNAATSTTSMVRATTDPNAAALEQAIKDYAELIGKTFADIDAILKALLKRDYTDTGENNGDDFARLGNYMFAVYEDGGTISIWMHETLGGVALRADVAPETYTPDEEFYFMIEADTSINGDYKAYPQFVVPTNTNSGEAGNTDDAAAVATQSVSDADAQIITFTNGVAYFTLKGGDEFALYIPRGTVTVTQLGSKSGGAYNVDVSYKQASGLQTSAQGTYTISKDNDKWLKGSNATKPDSGSSVSQQSVEAKFGAGQYVATIRFTNQIVGLSVKNTLQTNIDIVEANKDFYEMSYTYSLTINLPSDQTPFVEKVEDQSQDQSSTEQGNDQSSTVQNRIAGPVLLADDGQETETTTPNYYFGITVTDSKGTVSQGKIYFEKLDSKDSNYPTGAAEEANIWYGTFSLMDGQTANILMQLDPNSAYYWLNETNANGLFAQWTDSNGQAQADQKTNLSGTATIGKMASVSCYNYYQKIEVSYGYIYIAVSGGKDTESLLFEVSGTVDGTAVSVVVSVKGGGHAYVYVPLGTYTIKEISWAWRYSDISPLTVEVTAQNNTIGNACNKDKKFNVTGNNKGWLGCESSNSSSISSSSQQGN